MVIFLVVVVMFVLCATALLLGTLLGLLFPVTAFQEALLSTLSPLGRSWPSCWPTWERSGK